MKQEYEGWDVRSRVVVIGLAGFLAALIVFVVATGLFYNHRYAKQTRAVPQLFPSPVLETVDTAPSDTREINPPQPPVGIDDAINATVAQGDALWGKP